MFFNFLSVLLSILIFKSLDISFKVGDIPRSLDKRFNNLKFLEILCKISNFYLLDSKLKIILLIEDI